MRLFKFLYFGILALVILVSAFVIFSALLDAQDIRGVPRGDTRHAVTVRQFQKQTGFPKGRPGWVVDHIIPLCAGGPDVVLNMQWQTSAESYVKDKYERQICRSMRTQGFILTRQVPQ